MRIQEPVNSRSNHLSLFNKCWVDQILHFFPFFVFFLNFFLLLYMSITSHGNTFFFPLNLLSSFVSLQQLTKKDRLHAIDCSFFIYIYKSIRDIISRVTKTTDSVNIIKRREVKFIQSLSFLILFSWTAFLFVHDAFFSFGYHDAEH